MNMPFLVLLLEVNQLNYIVLELKFYKKKNMNSAKIITLLSSAMIEITKFKKWLVIV